MSSDCMGVGPPRRGVVAARLFIGEWGPSVRDGGWYCGHVTGRVLCCKDLICACWTVENSGFLCGLCGVSRAGVGGWSCEVWHGAGIRDGSDGDQTGVGEDRPVWRAVCGAGV